MIDETAFGLIIGSVVLLSSCLIVLTYYIQKKLRRNILLQPVTNAQSVTNSAPISRRSSSSCLIHLEKQQQASRSRSASFGEDLAARLHILAAGSAYPSYTSTTVNTSSRPSITLSARASNPSNTPSTGPPEPTKPSITFELRYEHSIETLFITVFELHNFLSLKNVQNVFLILYLLPNDDEQRQTKTSTNGTFNELFHFMLKADDLPKRTLRFTAYTVDSATRIRQTIGHTFIKLDKFINPNQTDKTFSSNTLSEALIQDLQTRHDYLGDIILTSYYSRNENLLHVRLQQVNNLRFDQLKVKTPLKAHFSGQTSKTSNKHYWTNSVLFIIPSSPSFLIDQDLKLSAHSTLVSTTDDHIDCHLRLHLHGFNQIHSHARWKHSLQLISPQTYIISLVAS